MIPEPTFAQMTPAFGRSLWAMLEAVADMYPDVPTEADQKRLKSFLNEFELILSLFTGECPCVMEWRKMTRASGLPVADRATLQAWVTAAHDWVNQKLGKPLYSEDSRKHAIFIKLTPAPRPEPEIMSHRPAPRPCCGGD